jgi:hypothetical protein
LHVERARGRIDIVADISRAMFPRGSETGDLYPRGVCFHQRDERMIMKLAPRTETTEFAVADDGSRVVAR